MKLTTSYISVSCLHGADSDITGSLQHFHTLILTCTCATLTQINAAGIIPPSAVLAWMLCKVIKTLQEGDSQKRGLLTLLNPRFILRRSTKAVLVLRSHKGTQPGADWYLSALLNTFQFEEVVRKKFLFTILDAMFKKWLKKPRDVCEAFSATKNPSQ